MYWWDVGGPRSGAFELAATRSSSPRGRTRRCGSSAPVAAAGASRPMSSGADELLVLNAAVPALRRCEGLVLRGLECMDEAGDGQQRRQRGDDVSPARSASFPSSSTSRSATSSLTALRRAAPASSSKRSNLDATSCSTPPPTSRPGGRTVRRLDRLDVGVRPRARRPRAHQIRVPDPGACRAAVARPRVLARNHPGGFRDVPSNDARAQGTRRARRTQVLWAFRLSR